MLKRLLISGKKMGLWIFALSKWQLNFAVERPPSFGKVLKNGNTVDYDCMMSTVSTSKPASLFQIHFNLWLGQPQQLKIYRLFKMHWDIQNLKLANVCGLLTNTPMWVCCKSHYTDLYLHSLFLKLEEPPVLQKTFQQNWENFCPFSQRICEVRYWTKHGSQMVFQFLIKMCRVAGRPLEALQLIVKLCRVMVRRSSNSL